MGPWQRKSLGEIATMIDYGVTASASAALVGPKFLRITDIQDQAVDWAKVPTCIAELKDRERCRLQGGDIVFARTGATTGKSFLVRACPKDAVFASYLIRVRPGPQVDPGYLARYFETPEYWGQISGKATGSAQPGVNASKLADLQIPMAGLPEQHRIAAILDKADAIRRKRREVVKLADEFLKSAFLAMFGDPVGNPRGWRTAELHTLADIASGVTKGRDLGSAETVMAPYMRVANVQDGFIDTSEVKTVEVLPRDVDRYRLQAGDVLVTEGGDPDKLGRGAVWRGQVEPCIHQNHIFRIRPDLGQVVPEYLSAILGSSRGKRYFMRAAKQTTGIASINMTQLRAFPALVPPIELQHQYAAVLARHEAGKVCMREAVVVADLLFDSLVERAFSGAL